MQPLVDARGLQRAFQGGQRFRVVPRLLVQQSQAEMRFNKPLRVGAFSGFQLGYQFLIPGDRALLCGVGLFLSWGNGWVYAEQQQ